MLVQPASNSFERARTGSGGTPLISVVVPVYKEEANIRPFLERIVPVLARIGAYEVLFCLDPSPDRTEAVIREEIARDLGIGLLVFSRRYGQPAATMAGILNCRGEWCAVIDVDLQDPPEMIETLFRKAQEGFDVVTARRASREGETLVKRTIARFGYKLINQIAEVPIPRNTGDFRVMNRRVIEELRGLSESHGFLRGLVSLVGFAQTEVLYERDARHAGTGNYNPYLGSLKIGFNGIFGFSTVPLKMMMWTGFAIAVTSALAIFIVILMKIWHGDDYPMGIPTITILLLFIGGVQLTALGVLGEYVGRIYDEVRRRPLYIVERAFNATVRDPRGPRSGPLDEASVTAAGKRHAVRTGP
jgi:polyisoprenyl-phosphate glycosyltransferase